MNPNEAYKRFRKGDRFQALQDVDVLVMTQWHAPYTGGDDGVVPKGEVLEVISDALPEAAGVGLKPVRYQELHATLVDEADRLAEGYAGYYLVVLFDVLDKEFSRVKQPRS